MAVRRIRANGGLMTDPSALDQPEGLRVAENVLLHRPGTIQPRPGFGDTTGIAPRTTDERPIAIVPFDGDLVVQSTDGSAYRLERGSVNTVYAATVEPPDTTVRGASSFAQARGSLYMTSATGIRVLEAASDAATRRAGVPTDYVPFTAGVAQKGTPERHAVGTESAVAYRYCWVAESNGYVKRSAPSSRAILRNESTSDTWAVAWWRMPIPSGIGAGDRLEIYRTVNVTPETDDPGDEMFLAVVHTISSAEAAAGYIGLNVVIDATPDDELGQALYTNASQQGIGAANERPPLANSLAQWGRCLWLGNTKERGTLILEIANVFDVAYPESWRNGAHYSRKAASAGLGATTLTLASVDGLKVGQYVSSDGFYGPTEALAPFEPLTKVLSIKTVLTVVNNGDIQVSGGPADYIQFTGVYASASSVGTGDDWRRVRMDSSLTSNGLAKVGATADETATNIAASINTTLDTGLATATATAVGATVEIVDDDGYALPLTISEAVAGTFSVSYEVTIDKPTTGAIVDNISFHDYIVVNGVEFYFSERSTTIANEVLIPGPGDIERRLIKLDNAIAGSETALDLARKLAVEIGYVVSWYAMIGSMELGVRAIIDDTIDEAQLWYLADAQTGPTSLAIVSEDPGGAVTVDAPVRPLAFRPTADGLSSDSTHRPARLWYSKPDEPEAFPLTQFVDVGDSGSAVLALAALDDALLVWKEDGLYSVTGAPPSSWVVDEVDTRTRLIAPECVCVLDGVCFALTDRGVVAATAGGVQVVSGPIATELRQYTQTLPLGNTDHKRAWWMAAHQRLGLVVLGVGSSGNADATAVQYVFHARAGGRWSKWTRADRCAAYDPAEDRMVVAPGVDSWSLVYERSDEDSAASYRDVTLASLAGTAGAGPVRIAQSAFAGHIPAEGDVLAVGSARARVAGVETDGPDYVLALPGGVGPVNTAHLAIAKTWGPGNALPAPHVVAWTPTSATVAGGQADPAGGLDASLVTTAGAGHVQSSAGSFPAGRSGWVSVWVKGSQTVTVECQVASVSVDLVSGAVAPNQYATSAAAVEIDGWRYVRFFVPSLAALTKRVIVRLYGPGSVLVYGPRIADATADPVVANASTIWTLPDGRTLADASVFTWHQSYPCTVEWLAQHLPGQGSRWQEAHVVLESDSSAYVPAWPLDVGGQPAESPTPTTITATVEPNGAPYQSIRVGLPRALIRTYQLGPRIAVSCAGVLWRVAELALHFTGQQKRVRR